MLKTKGKQEYIDLDCSINTIIYGLRDFEKKRLESIALTIDCIPSFANDTDKIVCDSIFENQEQKLDFNVFNCLTKHHLEELHTNFLYYLLNINETHKCNSIFLEDFIATLKNEYPEINTYLINFNLGLKKAKTIKNFHIGFSYETDIYGKIDIYVETPTFCFFIENKIGAEEQEDQIYRYSNYCKNKRIKYLALYLTKFGTESEQTGDEKYYTISYNKTILNWLNKSILNSQKYSNIASGLHFYDDLVRKRILQISTSKTMVEISELLKQEKNLPLIKHWSDVKNAIDNYIEELKQHFWYKINLGLKQKYKIDSSNQTKIKFIDDCFILKINKEICYVQMEFGTNGIFYGLFPDNYSKIADSDKIVKLKYEIQELLNLENDDEGWILWKWFNNGFSDQFFYELAIENEKVLKSFFNEIDNYLHVWQNTII